jgi:ectoine hydroxylase-related dioxygenase (phytanoyl-CoA dioxygenase family)
MLTPEQRKGWEQSGFFILRAFTCEDVCREMRDLVTRISREAHQRTPLSEVVATGMRGMLVQPYYFPFDRGPQVGIWLAITEATLENGCLHVLPGSHREPVHEHVTPRRPDSNVGYMEIVDHDMSASVPVLMQAGDLLVFHSHLMHSSNDNESKGRRAAMVYHYAEAGTLDRAESRSIVNDWVPVRRSR